MKRFRNLAFAFEAARRGGNAPCVLNAANEVAVEAFLGGKIRFTEIARVISETLDAVPVIPLNSLDDVLAADAMARAKSAGIVERLPGR